MNKDITYQVYSEFKTSDWYTYWDKAFAATKDYQRLIVWHIKADDQVIYDYVTLKKLMSNNKAVSGLPYGSTLSTSDIEYFKTICEEFLSDIDRHF